MFLLRAVLNILVRNASPRGPMCFRCLIFNLSGPCELLFLLCFISSPEHHHSMIALSIKIYLNITFVNMYNNTFIYIYLL